MEHWKNKYVYQQYECDERIYMNAFAISLFLYPFRFSLLISSYNILFHLSLILIKQSMYKYRVRERVYHEMVDVSAERISMFVYVCVCAFVLFLYVLLSPRHICASMQFTINCTNNNLPRKTNQNNNNNINNELPTGGNSTNIRYLFVKSHIIEILSCDLTLFFFLWNHLFIKYNNCMMNENIKGMNNERNNKRNGNSNIQPANTNLIWSCVKSFQTW